MLHVQGLNNQYVGNYSATIPLTEENTGFELNNESVFIDENSDFIDPLRNQISSAQNFLSGYTDIFMRIKDVGANFEAKFGDTFEKYHL